MLWLLDTTAGDFPTGWLLNPGSITVTAVMVFLAFAFWKGWIHSDAEFQRLRAERDALRESQDQYLAEFRAREREERKERATRARTLGDS